MDWPTRNALRIKKTETNYRRLWYEGSDKTSLLHCGIE
jgi:hypothetical protein